MLDAERGWLTWLCPHCAMPARCIPTLRLPAERTCYCMHALLAYPLLAACVWPPHPAAVKNAFGKQLGTANPLNNARATLEGIKQMRTFQQVGSLFGSPFWGQGDEMQQV